MMSTTRLIWATPAPSAAGAARISRRLTPGVSRGQTQAERHSRAPGGDDQPDELNDAADRDAHRQRMPRRLGPAREPEQGPDQAEIEQDRRRRHRSEAVERVQHPTEEGDQGNQEDVGEREARELHGQLELAGLVGEARRQHVHEPRHHDLRHDDEHQQRP